MQEDRNELDPPPSHFPCDPRARQFPVAWRDTRFRRRAVLCEDGKVRYECPICHKQFDHSDIEFLQGDHVWPYSLFGDSSWANYQLICGSCNARKRDFIDSAIRDVLGGGQFRKLVCEYLRQAASTGNLDQSEMTALMLDRDSAERERT